jgi:exopolyphosphatase/guanosine-5'-triphosphate,3'-diphosphate pyrophosphatase
MPQVLAAVDLGSNSFHMIVARVLDGQLHIVDRLQEMVRLAAGLDSHHRLDKDARARALACLARFGERLRDLPPGSVRAVGTNTLRRARNADKFLEDAEQALGHAIHVISGQEEARLIYQGVARPMPLDGGKRLVIDIGGGSTEVILGEDRRALIMESLHTGCVGLTRDYFPDGRITAKSMARARTAAALEFQPIKAQFHAHGWQSAYGTSGTIRAIGAVIQAWHDKDVSITPASLVKLQDALLALRDVQTVAMLEGVSAERAPVFPGGVAILMAAFEAFGIERLEVAEGALREGLLYDLLGRIGHEDERERTIAALTSRYHIDAAQAKRVEQTVQQFRDQLASTWRLGDIYAGPLSWAARLHEIGLAVSHTKYHRHGAYLVHNSDLPGFSWQEQALVATLIRCHRRRFPHDVLGDLPREQRSSAQRLCVLLRLAVLLHRARSDAGLPALRLHADDELLQLHFPPRWLKKNPLTLADLAREAEWLRAAKIDLDYQ